MKGFFTTIAYLFHPIILVFYMLVLLLTLNPYYFGYPIISDAGILLIYAFVLSFLIPLIGILLLKGTGLISSLKMENKMERIGPLIVVSLFYLWFFINCKNNPDIPTAFTLFVFGALINVFLVFFINIFFKVSIHTSALASVVIYFLILLFHYGDLVIDYPNLYKLITLSILILGISASGRLYLQAHKPDEVYAGILIGVLAQMFAFFILI